MLVLPPGRLQWKCGNKGVIGPPPAFSWSNVTPAFKTEVQLSFEPWALSWQATFLFTPIQTVCKAICFYTRVQASFIDIFLKSAYPCVKDLPCNHMSMRLRKLPNLQLFLLETFFFFFLRKPICTHNAQLFTEEKAQNRCFFQFSQTVIGMQS